jgi:hypothetical protein
VGVEGKVVCGQLDNAHPYINMQYIRQSQKMEHFRVSSEIVEQAFMGYCI